MTMEELLGDKTLRHVKSLKPDNFVVVLYLLTIYIKWFFGV